GLYTRVAALHRLTGAMLDARFQARMKTVEHPEKLTRVELQKKQDEYRKLAREGFADRLLKESGKHAKPSAGWVAIERLWIETLPEREPKPIAAACWEFLAEAPAPADARPEDEPPGVEKVLDDVLRERYLVTLTHLAARKGADPALVERLLNHLDQRLKAHPD